ncbi:hypothetical protein TrVE_jg9973 [Triparma verrucosa]|uniref:Uncharacterized protein n=1 Tax=Triparma verrucosa TaxID=1606542 RepID=A0A9W7KS30_9STRA|nr:hypothetical protein TrVE_jg9973 [Triparma verrucosa]
MLNPVRLISLISVVGISFMVMTMPPSAISTRLPVLTLPSSGGLVSVVGWPIEGFVSPSPTTSEAADNGELALVKAEILKRLVLSLVGVIASGKDQWWKNVYCLLGTPRAFLVSASSSKDLG